MHSGAVDLQDIALARGGDGEAYRRLVERHQDEIARRMRRFAPRRDSRVLEELVQDVFVEAYFSLAGYRGDAPFEHWLHRIAVRVGYRYWKSKKAEARRAGEPATSGRSGAAALDLNVIPAPSPIDPAHDSELLARVLEQLSPRDRLVVTLMYLEDRSVRQTAELTGWSQTMVKVQAFRARAKLRKLMPQRLKDGGTR